MCRDEWWGVVPQACLGFHCKSLDGGQGGSGLEQWSGRQLETIIINRFNNALKADLNFLLRRRWSKLWTQNAGVTQWEAASLERTFPVETLLQSFQNFLLLDRKHFHPVRFVKYPWDSESQYIFSVLTRLRLIRSWNTIAQEQAHLTHVCVKHDVPLLYLHVIHVSSFPANPCAYPKASWIAPSNLPPPSLLMTCSRHPPLNNLPTESPLNFATLTLQLCPNKWILAIIVLIWRITVLSIWGLLRKRITFEIWWRSRLTSSAASFDCSHEYLKPL